MFGHKTRRIARKAYTGVLKIFSDNNPSDFTQKYLTRNNHIACCTSDFYSLEKKCIHSQGFSNNSKHFPAVSKFVCPLNKPQVRWYSSNETSGLPPLTSLPREFFPGMLYPFGNLFVTYFVVKPQLDSNFSLSEFVSTSKKVVEIVSHKLAAGEIDDLADMVTPAVLQELRTNLVKFSVSERQELATLSGDIFFSTPSWMTVDNDNERGIKYLHIFTIHHAIKGFNELNMLDDEEAANKFKETTKGANKAHLLNYKFTRAYSSEVAGDWLISGINHYRSEQIFKSPFSM